MSKGENMVERCARAMHARLKATGPHVIDNWGDLDPERPSLAMVDGVVDLEDLVRAVIEALMTPTPEMLAAVDVLDRYYLVDQGRVYDEYDSDPAELSAAAPTMIFQAMLRTILSQPNEEGEGK